MVNGNRETDNNRIVASVIIPVYNEERYIENCILSLLRQDYPKEKIELMFVDGNSTDGTKSIIDKYSAKYPDLIKVYHNPNKTAPYAMNIGINESAGDYIIRLDAHSEYPENHISKCVHYLETIDADNVGGVIETRGKGFVGSAIALMLSSKFGVGNSKFRTNGESGYVDTVPFGAFRRDVFEKYGLFDERLTRNQDIELNYRIRKNGGKIYMATDIKLTYYCGDSIKALVDMAVKNGLWNVITMRLCPGSMGIRHFVPLAFLLSLIVLPLLSLISPFFSLVFLSEICLYLLLDIVFSIRAANSVKHFLLLAILFPVFHISYGLGSIVGIFKIFQKQYGG